MQIECRTKGLINNVQEQEKKAKEAELNQNLIEGSSIRMSDIRSDRILKGVSLQIPTCAPEIQYNLRDGANSETTSNQSELQAARESLATTRKRCEDLDRALNQV
jgi:hypothetical protein